jgi:hypothetical protein
MISDCDIAIIFIFHAVPPYDCCITPLLLLMPRFIADAAP